MTRRERTEQKMQLLFHSPAAGSEGTDGEFMQLLQGHIFGGLCWTGSLDERMRELVTVTVLSVLSALPQLKAHVGASLNAGCTPLEIREAVYECAPFIGFPKTLNAIGAMNEASPCPCLSRAGTRRSAMNAGWRRRPRSTGTR